MVADSASSLAARRGLAAGVGDDDEYEQTKHVAEQDELPAKGGSATAATAAVAAASKTKGEAVDVTAAAAGSSNKRKVCQNTCSKAKNGVCEDGRPPKGSKPGSPTRMVYCDLGTDCDDCGPWETSAATVSWEDPSVPGPIALLMSKDVQVRIKDAAMPPEYSFAFAYTDPSKDFDVSYHMETSGMVEGGITAIFYKIFHKRCVREDGSRQLFLDVGANFGWFAVMAASMGCRVIGFEPVPHFRAFFEYSVYFNDFQELVTIHSEVVNDQHNGTVRFVVPARGIWGTAGIDGANIDRAVESAKQELALKSITLDNMINEDVLLFKVDVEGFEWSVVKGAAKLLGTRNVENVIMEYSPGVPERSFNYDQMAATPAMLADLVKYGFRIGHIGDAGKHGTALWDAPLPAMTEVTKDNLKYDMHDVQLWREGKLGCPPVPELSQYPMWKGCGGVPEDISPRSLRSEIGHNTNLWASKSTELLSLKGVVGILPPNTPTEQFFNMNPNNFGQGSRPCLQLDPMVQVKHRCKCTKEEVCGEQEKAVQAAAQAGKLATNYVLP